MIAGVLLAAGAGRRFGAQKLLADVDGAPLVRRSVDALTSVPLASLIVVVPPDHAALRDALSGVTATLVVNERAMDGMGTSLARGVAALPPSVQAVIVALADAPASAEVLRRLVDRYHDGGAMIVAPSYRGVFAPPVLFDRSTFGELRALAGDHGARVVVERAPDRVARIDLDHPAPLDVDTPEDLARLRSALHLIAQVTPRTPRDS